MGLTQASFNTWSILKFDLVYLLANFSDHSHLLSLELNLSIIGLILKCEGTKNLKEFRHVSLCNVAYKIISNIMMARI